MKHLLITSIFTIIAAGSLHANQFTQNLATELTTLSHQLKNINGTQAQELWSDIAKKFNEWRGQLKATSPQVDQQLEAAIVRLKALAGDAQAQLIVLAESDQGKALMEVLRKLLNELQSLGHVLEQAGAEHQQFSIHLRNAVNHAHQRLLDLKR